MIAAGAGPDPGWRRLSALAGLTFVLLAGCAQLPLGEPAASFDNIEKAGRSGTAPAAVGPFRLDPGAAPGIDTGLSVRSNTVVSPIQGSFAQYLRQTLITDLQAAGLYDPTSPSQISGFLTDSTLNVPLDTGRASLGARFVVVRLGKKVYDKKLEVSASWPSSFVGMEAIPSGINQYGALYHVLVGKLLDDPDYQAANPK